LDEPGHYNIENIFLGSDGLIRPLEVENFLLPKKTIFEIGIADNKGFQGQKMPFFKRRYPLPTKSDFLD
jgi:hypothetical protein